MGLISAVLGATGGVLADQWKEYFYCDALPADVLVAKGKKRESGRSSNKKGFENIITNGSVIAVADGQCMIIVEQGKVVDLCAQPGEYVYDSNVEPSIFDGGVLSDNIKAVFQNIGKRFTFGGEAPRDQRIYYFNTKEIIGNKYGTPSPVQFRAVDDEMHFSLMIKLRCFGEYSYRITNPILFYTNVCSNVSDVYTRADIDSQMKSELLTHLQPALARISAMRIPYDQIPMHTVELAKVMREEMTEEWTDARGIDIVKFGVSSVKADPEDEERIQNMMQAAALRDPTSRAAFLASQKGQAMTQAASNTAGAAMGFMGMGLANAMGSGGNDFADLAAMQQFGQNPFAQQQGGASAANAWTCACGATATGKFCPQCGAKKPEPKPADSWKCPGCGHDATGKFCPECGTKKPTEQAGWVCACGSVNKGKFCPECGAKKPADAPLYRCDKCGWEPDDPHNPPKFCPECGDLFDESDQVKPEA